MRQSKAMTKLSQALSDIAKKVAKIESRKEFKENEKLKNRMKRLKAQHAKEIRAMRTQVYAAESRSSEVSARLNTMTVANLASPFHARALSAAQDLARAGEALLADDTGKSRKAFADALEYYRLILPSEPSPP